MSVSVYRVSRRGVYRPGCLPGMGSWEGRAGGAGRDDHAEPEAGSGTRIYSRRCNVIGGALIVRTPRPKRTAGSGTRPVKRKREWPSCSMLMDGSRAALVSPLTQMTNMLGRCYMCDPFHNAAPWHGPEFTASERSHVGESWTRAYCMPLPLPSAHASVHATAYALIGQPWAAETRTDAEHSHRRSAP